MVFEIASAVTFTIWYTHPAIITVHKTITHTLRTALTTMLTNALTKREVKNQLLSFSESKEEK